MATVTVKYFGSIADITKKSDEVFSFENEVNPIALLQNQLETLYPEIRNITYSWALNQSITNNKATFQNQDEIALLPPFAGG